MLSRLQVRLLSVLALFLAINATWFDANIYGRGIVARQVTGGSALGTQPSQSAAGSSSSASASPTQSSSSSPSASPTSSSVSPTSESATPSQSSTSSSSTSSVIAITTSSSTTPSASASPTSSSASPSQTPSSSDSSTSTDKAKPTTSKTQKSTPTPSVVVTTVVNTISGSLVSQVSSYTTTSAAPSATGELNSDGSPKKSTGMSASTRNTVIGVVVGIGGAIILIGLGIVAWRIWGRRRNNDESDGLMSFGGNTPNHEKTGSSSAAGGPSPFQSTLDNYHNPARNGNVNASSNF